MANEISKDLKSFSKEELTSLLKFHKQHKGSWAAIHKAMKNKFKKPYTIGSLQKRFTTQSLSADIFWSKEQKDLLVKLKHAGNEWEHIIYELNRVFGSQRSISSVTKQYKSLIESGEYKGKKGHDFTKTSLGEIHKEKDFEQSKMFVIAAVSPMVVAGRSPEGTAKEDIDGTYFEKNLHKNGWAALENFLGRNKAEVCVLPMRAHMRVMEGQPFHYDEELRKHKKSFVTDYSINGGVIKIIEAHLNPQQINPMTGLGELTGKKNKFIFQAEDTSGKIRDIFDKNRMSSIIVAHPKQMMEVYPTGFESTPRLIHSTGSMTDPQYIRNKVGRLAEEAHTLGFLILEIKGRKFWIRQVQCDPVTGEFVSMGVRYHADGRAERERADSIVFGDLHAGAHDPESLSSAFDMMRYFRPKNTVWHDIHDGKSYTHHDKKRMVTFLKNPHCFKSVENEGQVNRQVLEAIDTVNKEVGAIGWIIDSSNHNKHLDQALNAQVHVNDKVNNSLMSELYVVFKRGLNPLRALIDSGKDDVLDVIKEGYDSKFEWVEPNTDFIRWGVQLGQHGHEGLGGARGSKKAHSLAYNNAIVGHTHKPSIFNGVYTNGTLSYLRLGYNQGPQDWLHAHTILYDKGMREMIIEIKGSWCLENAPYQKIEWKD